MSAAFPEPKKFVKEAVRQREFTVAGFALRASKTAEVHHVFDAHFLSVCGATQEVVDKCRIRITLVGTEGNIRTGERCIMLDNVQRIQVMQINVASSLVDHVRRGCELFCESGRHVVSMGEGHRKLLVGDASSIAREDAMIRECVDSGARGARVFLRGGLILGPQTGVARLTLWDDAPDGTIREEQSEDGIDKVASMELENEDGEGNESN